ncbi:GGDEF domain-containing protein [Methylobacterium segetis]|uniref:GGDEF domain-containing protein n=1 Tax=Methylobacterium segetis TaxID=2488750 RepID=UPI0010439CCA|nr:diguanylate cyclase [Methylobacterium segetis]
MPEIDARRIEDHLRRPWHRLAFDPELEHAFRASRLAASRRHIIVEIAILATMCLAVAPIDYAEHPAWPLALGLRLGILFPIQLLAIGIACRARSHAALDLAGALSFCVAMAVITLLASTAGGETATRYLTVQGGLILVYGALTGQRPLATLLSIGFAVAAYDGAVIAMAEAGEEGRLPYAAFVTAFSPGFLAVRILLFDRTERTHFLHRQLQACLNRDLTRLTRELATLAGTDPLTGLLNRRGLDAYLGPAWAAAGERCAWIGAALVDIDYFKAFNDAAGHEAGDGCLGAVAGLIRSEIPLGIGRTARLGGEEFVVVLPDTGPERVLEIGERLRDAVERAALPHPGRCAPGHVTVSVGVASTIPCATARPADLLRAADRAVYEAKRQGRNRVSAGLVRDPDVHRADLSAA